MLLAYYQGTDQNQILDTKPEQARNGRGIVLPVHLPLIRLSIDQFGLF
jgi:hypothetical protein